MLIVVNGNLGSGKSLFLTIYAMMSKRKVVSNFHLERNYEKFNIQDFIKAKYEDCVILLDEAYQYIDSRNSMLEINQLFSYILFQSRKKNVELFVCSQLISTIDIRFRSLADCVIYCEKDRDGFMYTIFAPNNPKESFVSILPYDKAKQFFKYYNTNEIIFESKPTDLKYISPEEKIEIMEKLSSQVIKEFKKSKNEKFSRSFVHVFCMKQGIDKSVITDLYNYTKVRLGN